MFKLEQRSAPEAKCGSVTVPRAELEFSFSRSQGAGGQNVNKVNSKVTLKWDFMKSEALTFEQKNAIHRDSTLRNRINKDGDIVLNEQGERCQHQNREHVIERLQAFVDQALEPVKERIDVGTPESVKLHRKKNKNHTSHKKHSRSWRAHW